MFLQFAHHDPILQLLIWWVGRVDVSYTLVGGFGCVSVVFMLFCVHPPVCKPTVSRPICKRHAHGLICRAWPRPCVLRPFHVPSTCDATNLVQAFRSAPRAHLRGTSSTNTNSQTVRIGGWLVALQIGPYLQPTASTVGVINSSILE